MRTAMALMTPFRLPKRCLALLISTTFVLGAMFISCHGGNRPPGVIATSLFVHNGDVYVAGHIHVPTKGEQPYNFLYNIYAALWKNGALHWQSGMGGSNAKSVFVSGSDVYVAGWLKHLYSSDSAVLWKNGAIQYLYVGNDYSASGSADSVFVSADDVYVAGETKSNVTLWKNGVGQYLTEGSLSEFGTSVFVSGEDVYVAGSCDYYNYQRKAGLWKNGERQPLSDSDYPSLAESVFVSGDDVYVAGHVGNDAALWKNGARQNLADANGDSYARARSVFVSGSDVYVAGTVYESARSAKAVLWKNGTIQYLAGNQEGRASSVFVYNGDVYVAGSRDGTEVVWKNGAIHQILAKE